MNSNKTRGFTLVELLVVIAIIGILIGMLLPAVQQVREAARRSSCANNVKQMCLGLLNHESAHNVFPAGYYDRLLGGAAAVDANRQNADWCWATMTLPYLELNSVYDTLNVNASSLDQNLVGVQSVGGGVPISSYPVGSQDFVRATTAVLPVFQCPSGQDSCLITAFRQYSRNEGIAKTNYVACMGVAILEGALARDDGGAFIYREELGIGEMTDGLSNTIAIGERGSDESNWDRANWLGTTASYGNGSQSKQVTGTTRYVLNPLPADRAAMVFSFGSQHSGGANFGLLDGSVHFISETIEFKFDRNDRSLWGTYQKLSHRSDGFVLGDY